MSRRIFLLFLLFAFSEVPRDSAKQASLMALAALNIPRDNKICVICEICVTKPFQNLQISIFLPIFAPK